MAGEGQMRRPRAQTWLSRSGGWRHAGEGPAQRLYHHKGHSGNRTCESRDYVLVATPDVPHLCLRKCGLDLCTVRGRSAEMRRPFKMTTRNGCCPKKEAGGLRSA